MTLAAAQLLVLKVLKDVMEEKLTASNVEVVVVTPADGYKNLDKGQLEALVASM